MYIRIYYIRYHITRATNRRHIFTCRYLLNIKTWNHKLHLTSSFRDVSSAQCFRFYSKSLISCLSASWFKSWVWKVMAHRFTGQQIIDPKKNQYIKIQCANYKKTERPATFSPIKNTQESKRLKHLFWQWIQRRRHILFWFWIKKGKI